MDSPVAPRGSFEDEGQKLKACEENLRRYHQLALAGRLVGATMHEVNNRLAALTNLIFLVRTLSDRSLQSVEYLDEADSQLRSLGEITSRSLAFIRPDTEAKRLTWSIWLRPRFAFTTSRFQKSESTCRRGRP